MIVKEEIIIGGIYEHYKGNKYRVLDVAYSHENADWPCVIYHKCDDNGIFQSIRQTKNGKETIIDQPFYRPLIDWNNQVKVGIVNDVQQYIPRFKFIKKI
jgi:hypothetical protein